MPQPSSEPRRASSLKLRWLPLAVGLEAALLSAVLAPSAPPPPPPPLMTLGWSCSDRLDRRAKGEGVGAPLAAATAAVRPEVEAPLEEEAGGEPLFARRGAGMAVAAANAPCEAAAAVKASCEAAAANALCEAEAAAAVAAAIALLLPGAWPRGGAPGAGWKNADERAAADCTSTTL